MQKNNFRIGLNESRRNIFVVEREQKHALFNGKFTASPSPSRVASFDDLSIALTTDITKEHSKTLVINQIQYQVLDHVSIQTQQYTLDKLNLLLA